MIYSNHNGHCGGVFTQEKQTDHNHFFSRCSFMATGKVIEKEDNLYLILCKEIYK